MINTDFNDKVWSLCDESETLAYKVHSAVNLLRLIISEADTENLLKQEPLTGLPGILALFESVDNDIENLEKLTTEVLKLQYDIKTKGSEK